MKPEAGAAYGETVSSSVRVIRNCPSPESNPEDPLANHFITMSPDAVVKGLVAIAGELKRHQELTKAIPGTIGIQKTGGHLFTR